MILFLSLQNSLILSIDSKLTNDNDLNIDEY